MLEDPNPNYHGIRSHVHRKIISIKRCDDSLLRSAAPSARRVF